MKYYILKNIVDYLKDNCTKIKLIKRIDNNLLFIEFNNQNIIYIDITKGNSSIFKSTQILTAKKDFSAPFDIILQKRVNNSFIKSIELLNNDKILNITLSSSSSYKKLTTILQFEFTGKYTNIIILDENRVIQEALWHIDEYSSSRVVKVGLLLEDLKKPNFIPKMQDIDDVETFLYEVYKNKEKQNLERKKKQKISQVSKKIEKLDKLINSLPLKEELEEESIQTYEKANLLLTNLYQIKPYQKTLTTYNYEGKEILIDIDVKSSVSQYTDELFKKAKKLKQKAEKISLEKDNLSQKVEFLNRLINSLEKAASIDECEFLYPKKEKNQTKTKKSQQYESFFFQGYKILLGTSKRENIYLLENSKASDFWFHLKDRTSAHVIVQNTKKTLPQEVIEQAASICAKFSVDFSGNVEVDYTQRRNVKIQSGANVLYNPYTTIVVKI